jgi:hypothetical protein
MDQNIICECGETTFWWFGSYLRCTKCCTEFKQTGPKGREEFWQRKFNHETHEYCEHWERVG